jgi:hypothetical protein
MEINKAKEFIVDMTNLCNKYKVLPTDFYVSDVKENECIICIYYLETDMVESIKRKEPNL